MENNKHLADGFIDTLRNLANDLEQAQVDFFLGKAEAIDKIEAYNKNIKKFIHESKMDLKNGTGLIGDIRNKIERMEVKLELGKADLKDYLQEQKKNIQNTIHDLENFITKNI